MTERGDLVDGEGLIDPSRFPFRSQSLDIDWVEEKARYAKRAAERIEEATSTAHGIWQGMPRHYEAPEDTTLFRAMDPVRTDGRFEAELQDRAAGYMNDYVDEMGVLKQRLFTMHADATELRRRYSAGIWVSSTDVVFGVVTRPFGTTDLDWERLQEHGGQVPWNRHRPSLEHHDALADNAARLMDEIRDVAERLANRLRLVGDSTRSLMPRIPGIHEPRYSGVGDAFDVWDSGVSSAGLVGAGFKAGNYAMRLRNHRAALAGTGPAARSAQVFTRADLVRSGLGFPVNQADAWASRAGAAGAASMQAAKYLRWAGAAGGAFAAIGGVRQMVDPRYDGWRGGVDRVMGGVGAVGGVASVGMFLGAAACTGPVGIGVVVGAAVVVGAWELGNLVYDNWDTITAFVDDPMPYLQDGLDTVKRSWNDAVETTKDIIADPVGAAGDFVEGIFN